MVIRLVVLLLAAVAVARTGREEPWHRGTAEPVVASDLEHLVGEAATTAVLLLAAWVSAAVAVGVLRHAPGVVGATAQTAWRALVPRALRVLVAAMAGAQVALPALAADDPATALGSDLPRLDRPLTTVPARLTSGTGAHDRPPPVVVSPGDCLWSIARRSLGEAVSDSSVASEWPRWYERNREVIGDDPDLLVVGTVLLPPTRDVVPS